MSLLGIPSRYHPDSVLKQASLSVGQKMLAVPARGIIRPEVQVYNKDGTAISANFDQKFKVQLVKFEVLRYYWSLDRPTSADHQPQIADS